MSLSVCIFISIVDCKRGEKKPLQESALQSSRAWLVEEPPVEYNTTTANDFLNGSHKTEEYRESQGAWGEERWRD